MIVPSQRSAVLGAPILLAALGLIGCASESDRSSTDDGSEIITDHHTAIEDVPWTIALLDEHNRPFCSGALLADDWVLTSQHCVAKKATGFRVAAGFDDLAKLFISAPKNDGLIGGGSSEGEPLDDGSVREGQISTVDAIHRLDGYVSPQKGNDLALLHLKTAFKFSWDKRVATIALPEDLAQHASSTQPGASATASGWGGREEAGSDDDHEVTTSVLTLGMRSGAQKEADRQGLGVTISDTQLYGAFDADLLPGDMGCPLTVYEGTDKDGKEQNFLAGIASWRLGTYSTLFQSVVPHIAWIKATMANAKAP